MLCRSCKKNVESSMKHAITANSCPFCGNSIFDANEFAFRKSVARVLIKNGLENEEQINKIVDDVLSLAGGTERVEDTQNTAAPAEAAPAQPRPLAPVSAKPTDLEAAKAKAKALAAARAAGLDDGLTAAERNAPSRVLEPGPRPTAQQVAPGVDPIALAMKEFESANNLDAKFAREDQVSDSAGADDEDLAGVFFMERSEAAEKADRLRGIANSPRPTFKK